MTRDDLWCYMEENEICTYEEAMKMSPIELFKNWCQYEGLLGTYYASLMDVIGAAFFDGDEFLWDASEEYMESIKQED